MEHERHVNTYRREYCTNVHSPVTPLQSTFSQCPCLTTAEKGGNKQRKPACPLRMTLPLPEPSYRDLALDFVPARRGTTIRVPLADEQSSSKTADRRVVSCRCMVLFADMPSDIRYHDPGEVENSVGCHQYTTEAGNLAMHVPGDTQADIAHSQCKDGPIKHWERLLQDIPTSIDRCQTS